MKTISQSWSTIGSLFQDKQLNFGSWMLLLISGILQFIFSLSHVIALRNLLLLIAFLIAAKYVWQALLEKNKTLVTVFAIFILLQFLMLIIAGFVSDQPLDSLSEWKGQWLPTFMSFVVGIGLAYTLRYSKLKDPRVVAVMSILIPITIFLFVNAIVIIHDWILAGSFIPSLGGLGDHHGISGYLVGLIEPILIADMLGSFVKGKRILPIPGWATFLLLIFAIFSLIVTTNRNGIVTMVLALIMCAAMMTSEIRKAYSPKKTIAFVVSMLTLIFAVGLVSYKTDSRWQNFIETIPIAWDIDRDKVWLDDAGSNLPLTPSGGKVDISEYYRIAWAHEGWRMLIAHPWGLEISRATFHRLVLAKYGHTSIPHSHNSWIDFGLEVGIPGLALWGSILFLVTKFGWKTWNKDRDPLGLALAVLVIMFAIRGVLDSIFRDHEIEQFVLVASLLFSTLCLARKTNKITRTNNQRTCFFLLTITL